MGGVYWYAGHLSSHQSPFILKLLFYFRINDKSIFILQKLWCLNIFCSQQTLTKLLPIKYFFLWKEWAEFISFLFSISSLNTYFPKVSPTLRKVMDIIIYVIKIKYPSLRIDKIERAIILYVTIITAVTDTRNHSLNDFEDFGHITCNLAQVRIAISLLIKTRRFWNQLIKKAIPKYWLI